MWAFWTIVGFFFVFDKNEPQIACKGQTRGTPIGVPFLVV